METLQLWGSDGLGDFSAFCSGSLGDSEQGIDPSLLAPSIEGQASMLNFADQNALNLSVACLTSTSSQCTSPDDNDEDSCKTPQSPSKRDFKRRGKDTKKRKRRPYTELSEEIYHTCPFPGCDKKYVGSYGRFNLQTHIKAKHLGGQPAGLTTPVTPVSPNTPFSPVSQACGTTQPPATPPESPVSPPVNSSPLKLMSHGGVVVGVNGGGYQVVFGLPQQQTQTSFLPSYQSVSFQPIAIAPTPAPLTEVPSAKTSSWPVAVELLPLPAAAEEGHSVAGTEGHAAPVALLAEEDVINCLLTDDPDELNFGNTASSIPAHSAPLW